MEAEPKKDKYDEAKLELVSEMMTVYAEISRELGIFDLEQPNAMFLNGDIIPTRETYERKILPKFQWVTLPIKC